MSNESLEDTMIKNRMLTLMDEETNFHIQAVEVFTGDDEGCETDCVRAVTKFEDYNSPGILELSRREDVASSLYRLRYEPGVRIFLKSESGESFCLSVSHHKGGVYFDLDQLDSSPVYRRI